VKIRLQDKANAGMYQNTMDAVIKIARSEGPLAFFKGLESTIWRHALWNGGYFGTIPIVQNALPKAQSEQGKMFYNFIAGMYLVIHSHKPVLGAIAGTFGTILNTPTDVVKSRIQNQKPTPDGKQKYNWALPALRTIAQEEGYNLKSVSILILSRFAALYKGFVPKVVRLGPGGGILLVVFEFVSKLLREYSEKQ
jgi:solute carrier family 25 2-oxodicarboxylate transporter 21